MEGWRGCAHEGMEGMCPWGDGGDVSMEGWRGCAYGRMEGMCPWGDVPIHVGREGPVM